MRTRIVGFFLMCMLAVHGQSEHTWETYLNDVMTAEDVGADAWEETYSQLCELEQHPLNLNHATREDLEQLPFLSAQQVEDIMAYLDYYGPMKSLSELLMIASLDYERRQLLSHFVTAADDGQSHQFPSLGQLGKYGKHELMATGRVPFYQRKGDKAGYLGYPYRHWLKYQFTYDEQVKAGFVGAQDAGEPFLGDKNQAGYDYYTLYLQLRQLGPLESLVVGKYRVSLGMGLIINNSFGFGKLAMLQNLGRTTTILRTHSSRSAADYLQGIGGTVRLAKGLTATGFFSYRGMDATLNDDGSAATILSTGYHRTAKEMEKKNNLRNTTAGGSLRYQRYGIHAGLNMVATHLNRLLRPNTTALYRQHYPQGYDFLNFSTDYGYVHHRFAFSGETAMNGDGAVATINSLSLQLNGEVSLMALQRFYSYRYTSLYARSYSDGGDVQNESGLYLGLTWKPSPRLRLMVYSDYAYFPWAKYQVSQSSHAWDNLLQATYTKARWTANARYRYRVRQKDNSDKTDLIPRREHRGRLSLSYENGWSSRTQLDFGFTSQEQHERGLMVSQTLGYTRRWLRLNGGLGYFHTDSYDSRVSLYESGPLYTYGFSQFSGEGIRYWLMVRAAVGKRLALTAKLGTTDYFDRSTIGSGYQQIDGSAQTDLDLQMRWKF